MKLSETTFNGGETRYYRKTEIQSHARTLLAVVEKVDHNFDCLGYEDKDECNCPRGEALRLLGEVLK